VSDADLAVRDSDLDSDSRVRDSTTSARQSWGVGDRDRPDFEVGVVEGVVSGLLRSKEEGREPRTPQFSNQIDATVDYKSDKARSCNFCLQFVRPLSCFWCRKTLFVASVSFEKSDPENL
jgi:hypothetical protein